MKNNYAKQLLNKVSRDYNLISETFSRSREYIWPEMNFLFNDTLKKNDLVLDLGCGSGRHYPIILEKETVYIGLDSSEKLINIAKKKYPEANFQVGNALNLIFQNNCFDKIYSIAVLHHIPSDKLRVEFLNEITRVLKPKGLAIITVWNLYKKEKRKKEIIKNKILKFLRLSKLDFGDVLIDWQGIKNAYFHCFTLKELEKKISQSGLKIIKSGELISDKNKSLSNFYIIAQKNG